MSKRLIALLLALVMCVGLLAACGGNGDGTTGSTETKGSGESTGEYVRPDLTGVKIEYHVKNTSDYNGGETWLYKQMQKLLGVEINYIEGADIKLMVADKKPPELRYCNSFSTTDIGYGEDGAFINIYDYLDKMPNVKAYLEDPANAADVEKATIREGVMYQLPIGMEGSETEVANLYTFLYRKDIFDANNLTWPTNQEEFVSVLRKLKELYPNSQPFVMRNMTKNMQGAQSFAFLWGEGSHLIQSVYNTVFTLGSDGKYYLAATSQAYKEMAQFLKDLMAEGLLHASTMTITSDEWQAALVGGTSFITYDKPERLPYLNPIGQEQNADYRLVAGAPFNFGSYAKTTSEVATSYANVPTSYFYMIGNTDKVDDVCKFVDWLYSEEGILMCNWGIEGESYEVDAQGNKHYKDGFIANNGGSLAKTGLNNRDMVGHSDFNAFLDSCVDYIADSVVLASEYSSKAPEQYFLRYEEDELTIFDTYKLNLYNYALAQFSKFVLGQRDFSEWDKVTEELKATYHYDDLLKIHEDALARVKK